MVRFEVAEEMAGAESACDSGYFCSSRCGGGRVSDAGSASRSKESLNEPGAARLVADARPAREAAVAMASDAGLPSRRIDHVSPVPAIAPRQAMRMNLAGPLVQSRPCEGPVTGGGWGALKITRGSVHTNVNA